MDRVIAEYNTINDDFYFHHTISYPEGRRDCSVPESHDRFELFFLLQGEVEYTVAGQHYPVHPGDMIVISPNKIHSLSIRGEKPYERMVFLFDYRILNDFLGKYSMELKYLRDEGEHVIQREILERPECRVREIFLSIVENRERDRYFPLYLLSCTVRLAIELDRLFSDRTLNFTEPASTDRLIEAVTAYIQEHVTEPLTLDGIAADLYLSKSTLCHKFRREMNMTVNEYITARKIHYAADLIYAGSSAASACQAAGYGYYTTFYYNYRKVMGKSPAESKNRTP